ncbi:MAG: NuoM family protein, partial [Actinomycetota bacterium]
MIGASTEVLAFPILSSLVILPLLSSIVVALLGRTRAEWTKLAALTSSVTTGALSLWLLGAFKSGDAGFQFVSNQPWISQWGISWHLGVDGISLFLVVLTGILFPLVIVGIDPHHNETSYFAWMLLLQAGVMGSFMALDLFLFFVMFEIVLVPMYFLIGGWGYDQRVYAATKFFLYTMAGSAFMLVGIIATVSLARRDLGYVTFDVIKIAEGATFSTNAARWLFVSFAIAFAVKVPLFPVHTWLPDAHTQAPTGGSVILAGV